MSSRRSSTASLITRVPCRVMSGGSARRIPGSGRPCLNQHRAPRPSRSAVSAARRSITCSRSVSGRDPGGSAAGDLACALLAARAGGWRPSDGHAATAATVTNRGWLRMLGPEGGSKIILTGEDVESASDRVLYDLGSTTLVTTQRCLPILRSQMNPSFS